MTDNRTTSISTLAFAALILSGLVGAATADQQDPGALDAATKAALQNVITRQLDAFEHDNARSAEAFAAPSIQERFPEPSAFLDMVKEHYSQLIHPKSTTFGEVAPSPHGPLQKMTIVAADGTVWTAIYSFEQANGEWRISGCGLEKAEGQQDI
jgi:hypothetical protein